MHSYQLRHHYRCAFLFQYNVAYDVERDVKTGDCQFLDLSKLRNFASVGKPVAVACTRSFSSVSLCMYVCMYVWENL